MLSNDENFETVSSKRVIGFISFLIMGAIWILNQGFGLAVAQFIFEGFLWLTVAAFFATVVEKFKDFKFNFGGDKNIKSEPDVPVSKEDEEQKYAD